MNNLPNSWATAPLEYIARVEMGQSPESRFYNDRGEGLPFFQGKTEFGPLYPTVRKWCTDPKKIADKGDILLSVRAPVGPTNVATEQCCIGRGLAAVRAHDPVSQTYLLHLFRNMESWLSEQGTGTTFAAVSGQFLRSIDVALAPLNEQKRIADKLDAVLARVDACRDRLDRVPAILKRFRQSVLAAATSGKLTEDWRISNSEATGQYVSSEIYNELPDLPSSWCYERLGKLLLGLKYGTSQKCEYEKKGKPVFRIPNIGDGVLINDNMKYAELPEKEYQQLALQAGDILMIRSNGSVSLVGKTALVSSDFVGYAYAGYLIRLRPNEEVQPGYLNHVLASMWLRQQIEIPARSTSGINNINSEEVRNLLIPLPPIDEQTEIVRRVEALFAFADRLEARHTVARAQVEKLTPSTLAKAFRGELVPQDPNDEPASVLLERIHAQLGDQAVNNPKRSRKVTA